MATPSNNRPRIPVIVRHEGGGAGVGLTILIAAAVSAIFHGGILVALFLISNATASAEHAKEKDDKNDGDDIVQMTASDDKAKEADDPFITEDVDPARQDFDTDINYPLERFLDFSVSGMVDVTQPAGILNGDANSSPMNLPLPLGSGGMGQGGALENPLGSMPSIGQVGGSTRGMPLAGTFLGRSGATREYALRSGGGTGASEAAVTRGLRWLVRNQTGDGSWRLETQADNIAGTAFGLLPFLGAGHTHKPNAKNPYDKAIEKGLLFLIRKLDAKGNFGGTMYSQGLATIAMCEAYGLSQDPKLRKPAQLAVNYIVRAQHKEGGGWRYSPNQPGDTSVVGWQVMALKSAQMAGLDVPADTMKGAIRFLDSACDTGSEGYCYVPGSGPAPTMAAVGLLCRQYLQAWGPKNLRMINGVDKWLRTNPPGAMKNMYYYYYATQVMHHFGGQAWKQWNDKMRELLIAGQDKSKGPNGGSWDSAGEYHTAGRLMQTSLCLLTLEVYYRHLPLFYREGDMKMQ